jgi:hypothetical protein
MKRKMDMQNQEGSMNHLVLVSEKNEFYNYDISVLVKASHIGFQ